MGNTDLIIYPIISISVLYLLNRHFNYKKKLLYLLGSNKKYAFTMFFIFAIPAIIYIIISKANVYSNSITVTIFFSYTYLIIIPQNK